MKTFVIDQKSEIVIYGAAYIGRNICLQLLNQGYNIACFMDLRARDIVEFNGIPVINPQDYTGCIDNAIVIIATGNPLSDAEKLNKRGFSKIVYNAIPFRNESSSEIGMMHLVFDAVQRGEYRGEPIPYYDSNAMDNRFRDSALICENEEVKKAYVHTDLIFVETNEGLQHIYIEYGGLINYLKSFDSVDDIDNNTILSYSTQNAIERLLGYTYMFSPEERRVLTQTHINSLYIQSSLGNDGVLEKAVHAKWRYNKFVIEEKDVFQACYYISRGIILVPMIISNSDYEKWVNKDVFSEVKEFAEKHDLLTSYTLLEHPCLYRFPAARDIGINNRLVKIGLFLSSHKIAIKGKTILDIGAYYGTITRFFCRLDAKVSSVEYNLNTFEFGERLNDLLRCGNIESIYGGAQDLKKTREFNITVMLTVLYWHLESDIGLQLIRTVDDITTDMLIWESGDEIEREKEFIIQNSSFNKYIKICNTVGTGKVRELGVWMK